MKDQWTECQDLVEEVFGKRPESPDSLVQCMMIMADMILENRENKKEEATQPQVSVMH